MNYEVISVSMNLAIEVGEGRFLLSLVSANDRPAFALNIAICSIDIPQTGQRSLMIMTCGSKTGPVNECNFALINGSFKSFAHFTHCQR